MHSMSDPPPSFPIATLTVQPWPDPVIDAVGHEVRSPYVERFWLGLLGPSSTWLLRRLVGRPRRGSPTATSSTWPSPPPSSGSGARSGRHSPFLRSIDRCCRFGAAHQVDETTLRVRRKLPPLTRIQVARLPDRAAAGPRGVDRPARARAPGRTSCGSERAAWPSRCSSSARTPRPPNASSTPGASTPPSPTTRSPGRSSTAPSPSTIPPERPPARGRLERAVTRAWLEPDGVVGSRGLWNQTMSSPTSASRSARSGV